MVNAAGPAVVAGFQTGYPSFGLALSFKSAILGG
jgi:hypothetical protein